MPLSVRHSVVAVCHGLCLSLQCILSWLSAVAYASHCNAFCRGCLPWLMSLSVRHSVVAVWPVGCTGTIIPHSSWYQRFSLGCPHDQHLLDQAPSQLTHASTSFQKRQNWKKRVSYLQYRKYCFERFYALHNGLIQPHLDLSLGVTFAVQKTLHA